MGMAKIFILMLRGYSGLPLILMKFGHRDKSGKVRYKDSKTPKITQFGALAGQIQRMVAQQVKFTPRLLRQVALTGRFQAQLHRNLHSRAELETCQLGPPALGACKKYTNLGPRITPSDKNLLWKLQSSAFIVCASAVSY